MEGDSEDPRTSDSENFEDKVALSIQCGVKWTVGELRDVTLALQKYGLADMSVIAKCVKTKTEAQVKFYVHQHLLKKAKKRLREMHGNHERWASGRKFYRDWKNPTLEDISTWPRCRQWRKVVRNQSKSKLNGEEVHAQVIQSLLQKFYDEAREPVNSEIVNVKRLYKYLLDCSKGVHPGNLRVNEAAVLVMLRMKMQEMMNQPCSENLKHFIETYDEPVSFSNSKADKDLEGNVVVLQDDLYEFYAKHVHLIHSMNPMMLYPTLLNDPELMKASKQIFNFGAEASEDNDEDNWTDMECEGEAPETEGKKSGELVEK